MIVRRGTRYLGVVGLMDTPREAAARTITRLREIGITRMVMISGDNQQVAEAVARAVGLDEARGDLMPDDKVETIKRLSREAKVAMVGDGVNDAPAMANATVGKALRAINIESWVSLLLGGRIGSGPPSLFLIYSAGNFIECTSEVPFLQIGETKYGRPILDRMLPVTNLVAENAAAIASTYAVGRRAQALCRLSGSGARDLGELLGAITGIDQRRLVDWSTEAVKMALKPFRAALLTLRPLG